MKWTLMHGVSWDRGVLIGCMLEFGSFLIRIMARRYEASDIVIYSTVLGSLQRVLYMIIQCLCYSVVHLFLAIEFLFGFFFGHEEFNILIHKPIFCAVHDSI